MVSRQELTAQASLNIIFPDSLSAYPMKIIYYEFYTSYKDKYFSIPIHGSAITNEIKDIIRDAPSKTVVNFADIKADGPGAKLRSFSTIRIVIK